MTKVGVSTRVERLKISMRIGALSEVVTVQADSAPKASPSALTMESGIIGGVVGGLPVAVSGGAFHPGSTAAPAPYLPGRYNPNFNTEGYDHLDENPFRRVSADPLSTFSIDVDTASYANVRRFLNTGALPPAGAVRIEEMINYFRFDYPQPTGDAPFSITTELAECPWNAEAPSRAHRIAGPRDSARATRRHATSCS